MAARDLESLQTCIPSAQAADVSTTLVEDAICFAKVLQEEARRRAAAEVALQDAIAKQDLELLRTSVTEARNAGANEDLLRTGQHLFDKLEMQRKRRLAAESALNDAIASRDLERVALCLVSAQEEGVPADVITKATSIMKSIVDETLVVELQSAMTNGDYVHLITLCGLVPMLVKMDLDIPILKEAQALVERLYRYQFEIEIPPGAAKELQAMGGQLFGHIVEIKNVEMPEQSMDAMISMTELGTRIGFGFRAATNAAEIPPTCPTFVPGGPVLAEAYVSQGRLAKGKVHVKAGASVFAHRLSRELYRRRVA